MIGKFKLIFSVFKQPYTRFHTLFHLHVFQKTTNNITQNPLLKGPKKSGKVFGIKDLGWHIAVLPSQ